MNMYEFAKCVHGQAVKSGWWPEGEQKDIREVFTMIHCEWSEAVDAYRNGCDMVTHNIQIENKPEGIAVELIDGCIRVLDWIGASGEIDRQEKMMLSNMGEQDERRALGLYKNAVEMSLPVLVCELHENLTFIRANTVDYGRKCHGAMLLICIVFGWLRARGVDPEAVMLEKHAYNRTRAFRHGGKLC